MPPGKRQRGVKMMRIAVCDDEPVAAALLARQIAAYLDKTHMAYETVCFASADALLASETSFELVFLDIRMEGISGMEAAARIRARDASCVLVFVTALQEYVYEAFAVEAADYLLKPVSQEKLDAVLARIFARLSARREAFLTVRRGPWQSVVKLDELYYCEVISRKVYLHLRESVLDYYSSLEELEALLSAQFFRCHRSYLVNLRYVRSCGPSELALENGACVPVARSRRQALSEAMLAYLRG